MFKNTILAIVGVVVCVQISAAPKTESNNNDHTLKSMVEQADAIVQAKLISQQGEWTQNGVFTRAHFMVREDMSDNGLTEMEIWSQGGEAIHPTLNAKVKTLVSHGVDLQQGQEAIIFAKKDQQGNFRLLNQEKSYLPVVVDEPNRKGLPLEKRIPKLKMLKVTKASETELLLASTEYPSVKEGLSKSTKGTANLDTEKATHSDPISVSMTQQAADLVSVKNRIRALVKRKKNAQYRMTRTKTKTKAKSKVKKEKSPGGKTLAIKGKIEQ